MTAAKEQPTDGPKVQLDRSEPQAQPDNITRQASLPDNFPVARVLEYQYAPDVTQSGFPRAGGDRETGLWFDPTRLASGPRIERAATFGTAGADRSLDQGDLIRNRNTFQAGDIKFDKVDPREAQRFIQRAGSELPPIAAAMKNKGLEVLHAQDEQEKTRPQVYVSTRKGDGQSPVGSKENPYTSINAAVKGAPEGSVINVGRVGNDVYREDVNIRRSNIVLRSDEKNPAVIDGGSISIGNGVHDVGVKYFEIRNFSGKGAAIKLDGQSMRDITIGGNDIHHAANAEAIRIYGRGATQDSAIQRVGTFANTIHDLRLQGQIEAGPIFNGNVDGFIARGNVGYNNKNLFIDAIGGEGKSPNPALDQARNGVIEYNYAHGVTTTTNSDYGFKPSAAAYYSDGAKNVDIRFNYGNGDFFAEAGKERGGPASTGIHVYGNISDSARENWIATGSPTGRGQVTGSVFGNAIIGNPTHLKQSGSKLEFSGDDRKFANVRGVDALPAQLASLMSGRAEAPATVLPQRVEPSARPPIVLDKPKVEPDVNSRPPRVQDVIPKSERPVDDTPRSPLAAIVENPNATMKQKAAALSAIYEHGQKDANGRVHVKLNDGGTERDFQIARVAIGKNAHLVHVFSKGPEGQDHPVLRWVDRNGRIERQRAGTEPVDHRGSWWMANHKDSTVAKFGDGKGTRGLPKASEPAERQAPPIVPGNTRGERTKPERARPERPQHQRPQPEREQRERTQPGRAQRDRDYPELSPRKPEIVPADERPHLVRRALEAAGVPSHDRHVSIMNTLIAHESGWDSNAVNRNDINARRGHPSAGLAQTIRPSFDKHHLPGMDDIFNPLHNLVAGIRYAVDRYGSLENLPGVRSIKRGHGYRAY